MRSSFRGALLLGSSLALVSAPSAFAEDPLVPEGASRPTMGKELVLPPIINEAPPGTAIVLPPPGQEHLLGKRPDGSFTSASKAESRIEAEAEGDAAPVAAEKPKKRKSKDRAQNVAQAEAAPNHEPVVYTGATKTGVPDQSLVVAEAQGAEAKLAGAKIAQTNARMADLTKPAMGGPELAGPPKPADGMTDAATAIRDGDTLSPKQEKVLAQAELKTAPANAPAIERFEIAQATAAPLPVTPAKSQNAVSDWDIEFSGGFGVGRIETGAQNYFGKISEYDGSGSPIGVSSPLVADQFTTDDEDEVITYEAAARFNLTGAVEPLGGGGNVTPYVKVGVGGYDAEFDSSGGPLGGDEDTYIVAHGVGGEGEYAMKAYGYGDDEVYVRNRYYQLVDNIKYRGKENMIRALLEYGQTWHGSSGLDVTGFAQIAHTRRDYDHTLDFTGSNSSSGIGNVSSFVAVEDESWFAEQGRYATKLESNTTSFGLGVAVSVPLSGDKRWKADVNARGSYDVTTVEGRDTLLLKSNLIAIDNAIVAGHSNWNYVDSIRLQKTSESFGYGAGLGVSYEFAQGVSVRLGAEYTSQEAAPVVVRDGVNPSRIELEREDVLVGTLTATIKF